MSKNTTFNNFNPGELNVNEAKLPFNFWWKFKLVIRRSLMLRTDCTRSIVDIDCAILQHSNCWKRRHGSGSSNAVSEMSRAAVTFGYIYTRCEKPAGVARQLCTHIA